MQTVPLHRVIKRSGRMNGAGKQGFTIIEVLIVVVVIAILATITTVAYNGIQTRARATAITSFIRSAENAFRLAAVEDGRSTWWPDTDFDGNNNPSLSAVLANSSIGNYLSGTQGLTGAYDNDLDDYDTLPGCLPSSAQAADAQYWRGVSMTVGGINDTIIRQVDAILDDGDPLCGRVRYASANQASLAYRLSYTQKMD